MTQNDSLAKAIAYLGAVEVAPGRFAYYDLGLKRWMTVSADTLDLINTEGSVQSAMTWLAMRDYAQVMPACWSPEQRFAWREICNGKDIGTRIPDTDGGRKEVLCFSGQAQRITADLTTGAEIAACTKKDQ